MSPRPPVSFPPACPSRNLVNTKMVLQVTVGDQVENLGPNEKAPIPDWSRTQKFYTEPLKE